MELKCRIELTNVECVEYCLLDLETGHKEFYRNNALIDEFSGLFYKTDELFLGLFPTIEGPMLYYNSRIYPIYRDLIIELKEDDNSGEFRIVDYGIDIKYDYSKFLGFDVWSNKEDIDLFYIIYNKYKTDSFYRQYTKETPIVK